MASYDGGPRVLLRPDGEARYWDLAELILLVNGTFDSTLKSRFPMAATLASTKSVTECLTASRMGSDTRKHNDGFNEAIRSFPDSLVP